jgi:serine/threonine protein kinase, bacterial
MGKHRHRTAIMIGVVAANAVIAAAGCGTAQRHSPGSSATGAAPSATAPRYAAPTELPFPGLDTPRGVAVDSASNVCVAASNNHRVLKLAPGATSPTELAFGDIFCTGVAVDTGGNVYVTGEDLLNDVSSRVLKLASAKSPTELPFPNLKARGDEAVAVDAGGTSTSPATTSTTTTAPAAC